MPIKEEDLVVGAVFVHASTKVPRTVTYVGDGILCYKREDLDREDFIRPGTVLKCWDHPPKPKHVRWINVYSDYRIAGHLTKAQANIAASATRIACVRIEVEEGQFDEDPDEQDT